MDTQLIAILGGIIAAFSAITVAAIKAYGDYLIKKLDVKEKEKVTKVQENNQKSINHSIASTNEIIKILQVIQEEVKSDRINIWMFHNGGYYYTGESIQRMSMVVEQNNEGFDSLKHKFLNVPIRFFARNLNKLVDANIDYIAERNELAYQDALAQVNKEHEVTSNAIFKIKSSDKKDWIGILTVAWLKHNELEQKYIDHIKNKIEDISVILTPEYLT